MKSGVFECNGPAFISGDLNLNGDEDGGGDVSGVCV